MKKGQSSLIADQRVRVLWADDSYHFPRTRRCDTEETPTFLKWELFTFPIKKLRSVRTFHQDDGVELLPLGFVNIHQHAAPRLAIGSNQPLLIQNLFDEI